jgi:hypothetical protein
MRRALRDQRGQSVTETLLVSGILVAFIAAMYQMFLANEAVYHSITAAHHLLMRSGFAVNCAAPRVQECSYDPDGNAEVIWNTISMPEIKIPVIRFFGRAGLHDVRLYSNVREAQPEKDCPIPCKKSKMAAGTYMDPNDVVKWIKQ